MSRLLRVVTTTFAGSDGLTVLLCLNALVVGRVRLPEIIAVFVGPGSDGKTMVLVDLMRAV